MSAALLAAIFSSPAFAALRAFDQRQTAVQVHAVRSSISAGMAVYVAYAGVQVSALGGTAPAYDIYDSENYPRVSLTPQTTPSLPLAHHRSSPIATCFCLSLCIESFGPHGCLLFTQHQWLQREINLQDKQRLCGLGCAYACSHALHTCSVIFGSLCRLCVSVQWLVNGH